MTIEIPLTQGKKTIIDRNCLDKILAYSWCALRGRNGWYAVTNIRLTKYPRRKYKTVYMHRLIMGANPDQEIDHRNGNGLDNRRDNLRFVTRQQNRQNTHSHRGVSIYKGVSWNQKCRRWHVLIGLNRRRIHIGYFKNEHDAARAYNDAASRLFGEYARLNRIDGGGP